MHTATNLAVVLILSLAGLSVLAQEPTPTLTEAVKILQLEVIQDLHIRIADLETEVVGKGEEAEGLRATIKEQQEEIKTIPGLKERLGEEETLTKSLQQKIKRLENDFYGENLLVKFMTKVLEQSKTLMTSREETISTLEQSLRNTVTQKEQYKQDNEVCLAQQKTTTETIETLAEETKSLKNVITLENKLNASRNTMVTMMSSCKNIPTFTMNMAESLTGQANKIALLKTALEDQAKVEENLEVIKTELVRMSSKISQTDPDCRLPNARNESVTSLLEQQSASLKQLRVVASYSQMAAGSGLRYQEDSSGHLVSASLCPCRTMSDLGDPQCSQAYVTLSDSWRRVVYSSSAQDSNNCDKTLSPGWYRFSLPDQSNGHLARIPTSPPATEYAYKGKTCGTGASAWMDASLPSIGHPPKDVTMKFAYNGRAVGSTTWNTEAKVVACSEDGLNTFYLYHLSPTAGCNKAYCATAATTPMK